ncbi:ABC transporter permease [Salinimonas sediminis]|uniref:ABC transporter permease n=1 Tax=Salinimonas sediminis TaxID=2303538 RepID=A0A346NK36_9ALTE|nr:ABC transporter permease [Salinimonas sediminis]AXR05893.1 ABC transporter permease [Salinimonas sediminis]
MWMVFIKEMKEVVRDRKTMFFMILLPLLIFPLIIGAVAYFSTKAAQDAQSKTLTYAIVNAEAAPHIDAALAKADGFKRLSLPANTSIDSWVKSDGADFVLAVPPDYDADPLQAGNNNLELYYNGAGFNAIEARLNTLIDPIAKANQRAAFDRLEITPAQQSAIMAPIVIKDINVADERENIGEVLGGLVAYVIFILCLQGAMIPAADLGAGEKERGTLETLLISPIDRHKIVLGKFLTIATAGVTTALISVLSMAVWGILVGQSMAIEVVTNFMGAIGLIDFLLIFLMLIPVVAIFAAVLLSLSIYAKTFKEAQSYMGPLVMVIIVPIVMATLPGIELKGIWAWVPLTNVALAMKELIKGTMDYYQLIGIFGSTAVIGGGLLVFCVHWFNKEKVLFR